MFGQVELPLVNLSGFLSATLEHAGDTFQKRFIPCVTHRRMKPEPAGQFGYRLFTLQRFQRRFGSIGVLVVQTIEVLCTQPFVLFH